MGIRPDAIATLVAGVTWGMSGGGFGGGVSICEA